LTRNELNLPSNQNVTFELYTTCVGDENEEAYSISSVMRISTGKF